MMWTKTIRKKRRKDGDNVSKNFKIGAEKKGHASSLAGLIAHEIS